MEAEVRIVVRHPEGEWDLVVHAAPAARVVDLLAAVAPAAGRVEGVVVDGGFVPGERLLADAGLHDGSVVEVGAARDVAAAAPASVATVLEVVGGVDAGRRLELAPGTYVVGRGAPIDLPQRTVSRRHAAMVVAADGAVAVADLGSRNGTWRADRCIGRKPRPVAADDVLRVGSAELTVRPKRVDDRSLSAPPAGTATAALHRPPRAAPAAAASAVELPEPPARAPARTPLSIAALLVPVVMAALLVKLAGNPAFALFALLSPILMVSGALEQRRRGSRTRRRAAAHRRVQLAALGSAIEARAAAEHERLVATLPDLAEVVRRATLPSVRLWERRAGDLDERHLRVGTGDVRWLPPLVEPRGARTPEVDAVLARTGRLRGVPIELDLRDAVVGIAGDRGVALAVARALVLQAAVHQGPADVAIAVLCAPAALPDWDWAKWLPHVRAADGALLASSSDEIATVAESLAGLASEPTGPVPVVVVDDPALFAGRRAALRPLLQGRAGARSAIVIAETADGLPAECTIVIDLQGADGIAGLRGLAVADAVDGLLVAGCSAEVARDCARRLARFDDADLVDVGGALPHEVALRDVVAGGADLADAVGATWAAAGVDAAPAAVLGIGPDGPLDIDLERDGPHVLVAGTTGAGKSELLRSLVAGLAAALPPEQLTFLLVDFKGGSAFDACARLPHCVGVVTDLDEHLAERVMRSLDAELRRRERVLRAVGVDGLAAYRRSGVADAEPLPRLVVVIDEFATLKAEVPGFVDALVGVAQRGRSLGVHLVLATQRPAGAVSDNIRANTGLRIALRVHDASDAVDVIGDPAAAGLPRRRPGRALVRFGPGELIPMQTARATGRSAGADRPPVVVTPFAFGASATEPEVGRDACGEGPTDLDLVVEGCARAFAASGRQLPRRPWLDPLPSAVALDDLPVDDNVATGAAADRVPFALADDPDGQRRALHTWRLREGNLLVWGISGSGTTTTLATIAVQAADAGPPDQLHLYVIGRGTELGPLARLPHCAGVIDGADQERAARLLRTLRADIGRRRSIPATECDLLPTVMVFVDGYASFAAERNDPAGLAVLDDLHRVLADGPAVGIHTAMSADRAAAIPTAVSALVAQRLVLRLADAHDHALLGATALPRSCAGRGIDVVSGLEVQVARPRDGLDAAVERVARRGGAGGPAAVAVLPEHVELAALPPARLGARPWLVPIGLGERGLAPVGLSLHEGDHAVVAGPARSGRSAALLALASSFRAGGGRVVAVAGPRSPLSRAGLEVVAPADVAGAVRDTVPTLVLVDDADGVLDPSAALAALVDAPPGHVSVVVGGRADALRTAYGHWARGVRRSRVGVLLQPDTDLDGELIGRVLPRRAPVALTVGRGWLSSGADVQVVQIAT